MLCVFSLCGVKPGMQQDWQSALLSQWPQMLARPLWQMEAPQASRVQELRFYVGQEMEAVAGGECFRFPPALSQSQMDELIAALCGYARYAREEQMAQGYVPLVGGHRAGVCGRMTRTPDGQLRMTDVTSVCIRIARSVPGASMSVRPHLTGAQGDARRVLVLGPPGCGKTTVLRDAALYLSGKCGLRVSVADEREELFVWQKPEATGARLDVLGGVEKARAVQMLLRVMAPQVIVTDEIGRPEDVGALLDAARCGVGLLASAHARSFGDVLRRPVLRVLHEAGAFDRYLFLGSYGRLICACDENGQELSSGL